MRNIILTGMMGCGKSTIGKLLNQESDGCQFVDIDEEIVKETNLTIPEIFEKYGEEEFRKLETKLLKKFCTNKNCIISTGGGVVERQENIETMKQNGTVIYLKADASTLYERVKEDKNRPMLYHNDPLGRLKELLEKREPFYKTADFEIDTVNKTPSQIIVKIKELLE